MKYLKSFNTYAEYQAYINGSNKILPNVSYCKDNNEVYFNPWVEPIETRIVAKFNVTSTSSATNIMGVDVPYSPINQFTEIEIDGVVQPTVVATYTFNTIGEHTVKYTLANPTTFGSFTFYECTSITNITIPNSVTEIGGYTFQNCTGLTSVIIPEGVTTIDYAVFQNCTGLTNIIIQATTPPTLPYNNSFSNTNNCPIYVPSASVETYKAATNWSSLASRIQPIPQE